MTAWGSPSRPAGRADLLRLLPPRSMTAWGRGCCARTRPVTGRMPRGHPVGRGGGEEEEDLTSYSAPAFAGRARVAAARPRSAFSSIADEAAAPRWGGGGCVRGACSRGAAPATGRPLPPLSPSYIHHFALRGPCAPLLSRPPLPPRRPPGRRTLEEAALFSLPPPPPCMPRRLGRRRGRGAFIPPRPAALPPRPSAPGGVFALLDKRLAKLDPAPFMRAAQPLP